MHTHDEGFRRERTLGVLPLLIQLCSDDLQILSGHAGPDTARHQQDVSTGR